MSNSALTDDQINNFVMRGMAIPVQPQVMVDLQMEQVMPDPDINEIARLISRDVSISGRVLKAVNSPFFGLRSTITSIHKAVTLLGYKSVINLVNAIAISNEMLEQDDLSEEDIKKLNKFWDTAQDVALVAATIARQIGFQSPDEAYTLGLIHNAGIPMQMKRFDSFSDIMVESYSGTEKRIVDAENKHFNTNHAVLGFYIAKSWKLSGPICEAIQQHHNVVEIFGQAGHQGSESMNLIAILKIAEHIVGLHNILGKNEVDIEWNETRDIIFQYLSINQDDYEEIKNICLEMGIG